MISPSKLPTDNLYKFIFLMGLVGFLFSMHKNWNNNMDYYTNLYNSKIEYEHLVAENKGIGMSISNFILTHKLESCFSKELHPEEIQFVSLMNCDSISKTVDIEIFNKLVLNYKKNESEKKIKKVYYDYQEYLIEVQNESTIYSMSISAILIVLGSVLWYFKLQIHLDRSIREISSEVKKTSK